MQALFNPDTFGLTWLEFAGFVFVIRLNRSANTMLCLVDSLEGRKSLDLISARYESIETGQEVTLRFTPRLSRLGVAS